MSKNIPLEYLLVIKILEECGYASVLKKFLRKSSLIDEYKQEKIEKIDNISLNAVRNIAKKCIKKCRSLDAINDSANSCNEDENFIAENVASNEVYQPESSKKEIMKVNKKNRKISKPTLLDNTYWNNKSDDYATKAALDLECVRGKQFRNEKNKKKKSSWKGIGSISTEVNSIMFEDSD